jgi:hypothetical protein
MTVKVDPNDDEQADEIVSRLQRPPIKWRVFEIKPRPMFYIVDYITELRPSITPQEDEISAKLAKQIAEEIDKELLINYGQRENRTR